ncbi:stalk domain-containing protein [Pseudobacteroides cellulosolvens]|uniref:Copper amine oxidase-like domain-containing protein n=1 Tax=Pseudobacteroides cellulosolvens ATCC 35603 = DSM 2933 TaxID=398512 RepID=A0A0L6JI62_9FIRM|nr:DUF5050 domain-containing protein [Pseudobacteroides cellulosolvens]KNY25162.1 copper amine oxidase-like domain-containing protein [Pseudobacteroides cellulosolvens ATCC 35603 = DSM 2933]
MRSFRIKIILSAILAVFLCSSLILLKSQAFAAESDDNSIKVAIDDKFLTFDVPPSIISGRTMVPLRVIFEGLGASVTWDEKTKTVIGKKQGKTIKLTINNKNAYINGKLIKIDVPPKVISGRTLVPTRFIAESLGTDVYWEAKAKIVSIIPPQAIKFSDAKLEAAIRSALKKTTGSITTTDAKKIKTLNLENKGIANIEGLQYFRGLTELNLMKNNIKDIKRLGCLTELKTLKLSLNRISDIYPLENLTKLWMLWLMENQVKDIGPLKELKDIAGLDLRYNQIFDLSPLKNLKKMDYLHIRHNPFTDISVLKEIKNTKAIYIEEYDKPSKIDQQLIDKYNKFDKKVKEIIANVIKPEMKELEKEIALHDYIAMHVRYDMENFKNDTIPSKSHTAYGALMENVAVCDGYARSLQILLNAVGIECIMVTGNAEFLSGKVASKNTSNLHAWNIVKIDGVYYQVDPTSNDKDLDNGKSDISYYHFNISDKQMGIEYTWDREAYPVCSTDGAVFDLQNREKRNVIVSDNQYFFINSNKNIVKMPFDTKKKMNLCDDKAIQILLYGDWIYYINETDGSSVYKIKTDGTSRTKLCEGKVWEIEAAGESIYYTKDFKVNRMNLDGSNNTVFNTDNGVIWVDVIGDAIYYKAFNYGLGARLVKSDLSGYNKTHIPSDELTGIFPKDNGRVNYYYVHDEHIINDWIYYINSSDQKSIYKNKIDGTERTKLTADSVAEVTGVDMQVFGEYIYYKNASDAGKLYRIKTDGSNRIALE